MAWEYDPLSGYETTVTVRLDAVKRLVWAAHGILWGQIDNYPFWHSPDQDEVPYWLKDYRRVKFLAIPRLDEVNSQELMPAELRFLGIGGINSISFYSLQVWDVELVWNDIEPDVLVCDTSSKEIVEGWDSPSILALAERLNYGDWISFDPRTHHVSSDGELVAIDSSTSGYLKAPD